MYSVASAKRIMIVGDWKMIQYEPALAKGFEALGWAVCPFKITDFLGSDVHSKIEKKLLFGSKMKHCNQALLEAIKRAKPDVILLYKPIHLFSSAIARVRELSEAVLVSQCNDNPYEDGERFRLWRHYHKNIQHCDLNFFSRPSDLEYAARENVKNARWLKFSYVDGLHRPIRDLPEEYKSDVIFVGHYESDGRAEILEFLLQNGVQVRVFGQEWQRAPRHKLLRQQNIRPVYGQDYVRYISGAKIALVFLSQRNRDLYTVRCFEIPACKTLMIAPQTPVLQQLYREGEEAVFFGSRNELLTKVCHFLRHDSELQRIAEAGYRRCLADGHSNVDRAREIISAVGELFSKRAESLHAVSL